MLIPDSLKPVLGRREAPIRGRIRATHLWAHICDPIRRIFGLAPAEARLLSALIDGQTIAEHAELAGITLNTAKTQLRQIFFKTGHNRQADLIRAALADPLFRLAGARDGSPPG